MFTSSLFDPGLYLCLVTIAVLAVLAWAIGRVLVPTHWTGDDWLLQISARLTSGLLFLSAVGSIICLHRFFYTMLIPLVQIAVAIWSRKQGSPAIDPPAPTDRWGIWQVAGVVVACVCFEWWQTGWLMPDGSLRVVHYDYGYWALLIKGVMESHTADGWSATLGAHVNECAEGRDGWYHWSPLMLAGGITSVTGMMPLASLLHVVATMLDVTLVLVAGALVRQLTRLGHGRSLLIGAASLVAVQLWHQLGLRWLGLNDESDSLQHSRVSLAYFLAYKFEAMILLLAMVCWLRKQMVFALALLACAAISAPHSVAMCGVTAGTLGAVGILARNSRMWKTAAAMIVVLIAVWAGLNWVCGVGLPRVHSPAVSGPQWDVIRDHLHHGLIEACMGLVLGALSLPGIVYLIFARDERLTEETRILGWMALGAIVGSFMGYRLLTGVADNWHIVLMAHAVLVMPAGIWGLACLASSSSPTMLRLAAVALILFCTIMGIGDLVTHHNEYDQTPWKRGELDPVKLALRGRPVGYFATRDRPWWLPWHSSFAAMLDVRCMRLQEILAGDVEKNAASTRPYEILPPLAGETQDEWSLRFARKIGIECIVEFSNNPVPSAIKAKARELVKVPYVKLYELLPEK